ncbi:uncharacterized protein METZ01_LOCUS19490 [marine metagenome]|uniref:Tetratricopeptide repeat-like domain-containing protein n=1 Tax=marine metagenome TaxID=408172 RepID=A0A381PI03_9ZZZZ
MKKIFILINVFNIAILAQVFLPFFIVNNVYSQYKGNVNKAEAYLNKSELKTDIGEKRSLLIDAKGEIDLAMTIEKNNIKARSWYVQGNVYSAIAKQFLDIDPNAIEKAAESFKSIGDKIKTNDISLIQNANVGLQNLSSHFVNQAILALQGTGEPNYEIAYEEFVNSLKIYPKDTLGLLYGGYVAEQLNKYDVALGFYNQLIEMNILTKKNTNTIYQNSINILFNHCDLFDECDSFVKSMKLITEGKNIFPENNYYPSIEINIAMRLNKVDDARKKIDNQLKADPTNASLHFNRAVLYYNLGLALGENLEFSDKEKLDTLDIVYKISIEAYQKSLEFDENNEKAIIYMIDAYKAYAKPYYDQERNLDFIALKGKYQSESNRLKKEGNDRLSGAVVYAKAYMNLKGDEISDDDIGSLYPVFSIIEDYKSLISILKISINRDKTNIEHLEVLRNAYIKIKDYVNAEKIYQLILELE